ncbi:putative glycolipid-binding domain-containing protein [Nocardiopsis sp. CNT312]|uniref:putative glycolipid-binding domain-containing protein n=1 Tax=Nocardiopsis sp. CNT312 TaxID=1137268 RepID=UPI00048BE2A1|nr:putative glycolipid-binding domain-containing protein [Nocardiopsis sp. CNT312]
MSSSTPYPAAWTRTDVSEGLGLGSLLAEPCGYRLEAGEAVAADGERFFARFTIRTDLAWTTREVRVEAVTVTGPESVRLTARDGRWSDARGCPLPELMGCLDVDVAATPLTSTLPIRRLGLRPGEHREIAVARIDIPSLTVSRMRRSYTRHPARGGLERYTYRDPIHGEYEFSVDTDGVVVDYERFARRVRPGP